LEEANENICTAAADDAAMQVQFNAFALHEAYKASLKHGVYWNQISTTYLK